ncbi:MAG: hypothetical protein G01um101417_311 [Parcubacteria group bacterium Gr01-1014_17]|nr:MAG: hypothetical protein G01um101417_311 [Parcubacteria group bacterium Gr01-1014_17]
MLHNFIVFFETILFLYISYVAGRAFLPRLGVKAVSGIVVAVQAVLLGLGMFALAGLAFGLLGIFNAVTLWAFTAMLVFVARKQIRAHFLSLTMENTRRVFHAFLGLFRENTFLKILIAVWLVANFSLAFVPLTAHDTIDYHLPIVLDIVEKGRTDFTSAIEHYSFTPVLAEILYAVPAVLFNEKTAPFVFQPLQYMTLPLFLALAYGFLRDKLKRRWLAPAALLAVLGMMALQREVLHMGYVDTFAFLYGFAALFPLLEYASQQNGNAKPHFSELMFSAVMLGISLGMKYFGFFFGVFAIVFLVVAWRRFSITAHEMGRMLFIFCAIVAAISLFWYAKNWFWFDNPLYPMFSSDPAIAITQQGIKSFLLDRTFLNFFIFPFALFGQWFLNPAVESSSNLVIFAYFVLLYLLVAPRIFTREKFTRAEVLLFVFVHGYLAFHFVLSHYLRYLLPSVMILPVLLALLADRLFSTAERALSALRFSVLHKTAHLIVALAILVVFLGNFHYFQIRFSYILGIYNEQEYVRKIGSQ